MKWMEECERDVLANELAQKKYPDAEGDYAVGVRIGYSNGLYDAMLSLEDIKRIHELIYDCRESSEPLKGQEEIDFYTEVLKRFNEIKFKK